MLFLPSAPTISLTVPTSAGLPSLRVIQCSSRKLGTFISQSLESHGFMSRVEAEAEAEWPASVALLEAFSGYGVSSIVPANRAEARERARRMTALLRWVIYSQTTRTPRARLSRPLVCVEVS